MNGAAIRNLSCSTAKTMKLFDIVVANPPFSLEKWGYEKPRLTSSGGSVEAYRPRRATTPFVLHMIETLKPKTGRMGVVVPHGVFVSGRCEGRSEEADR